MKKDEIIQKLKKKEKIRILFNCSGNIMRSAYAEMMFEKILQDKFGETRIISESGGVIYRNDRIAYETKKILIEEGVSPDRIKKFRPRHIDYYHDAFKNADLILTMSTEHLPYLQEFNDKTFLLNEFAFNEMRNIADPFFEGSTRKSFAEVKKALFKIIDIFEKNGLLP